MGSLGERLRKARESQGRKLSQIAEETRIQAKYLEAIEAEDWDAIPGGFFRKSFVQQYARNAGVPESEFAPELARLAEKEGPPLLPGQETRREGSELPSISLAAQGRRRLLGALAALVIVLAGCAAFYSAWLNRPEGTLVVREAVARQPATATPPQHKGDQAQARPLATELGRPNRMEAEGPLWIKIEAKEATWVKITSGRQELFAGVLEPNQTKRLDGLEKARVIVGNAGGLEIVSNGRPIGPIGNRGQVRVIVLTPEGAEISRPKLKTPSASVSSETSIEA
jgi:transcriptional regulator with XRE-family HTH domain